MKSICIWAMMLVAGAALCAGEVIFADGKVEGTLGKGVTVDGKDLTWTFKPPKSRFQVNPADPDMSGCQALEIAFDASRAGDKAVICFVSNPEGAKDFNYYYASATVEKAGVQTWTIAFDKCKAVRKPLGWNSISAIQISFDGWGLKNEPGLTLKVQSIKLIKK